MNENTARKNDMHNCDLFMLSSHHPYYAKESLTEFAILGHRNTDGWGLGSYDSGHANIVRSSDAALADGEINREFRVAMSATHSSLIIGHLRLTSSGKSSVENNHPFKLHFLGYDWLLIHNGTARCKNELVPYNERLLLDSDSDTPRIFEFMRHHIINYYYEKPAKSLIESCCYAYKKLLDVTGGVKIPKIWRFINPRIFYCTG
jgi:predicted glutamine amidotransferase